MLVYIVYTNIQRMPQSIISNISNLINYYEDDYVPEYEDADYTYTYTYTYDYFYNYENKKLF
jgi:hypothetical protein